MGGGGASLGEVDRLYEENAACRELWMRFLSRSAGGKEGWLATVHAGVLSRRQPAAARSRAALNCRLTSHTQRGVPPSALPS